MIDRMDRQDGQMWVNTHVGLWAERPPLVASLSNRASSSHAS